MVPYQFEGEHTFCLVGLDDRRAPATTSKLGPKAKRPFDKFILRGPTVYLWWLPVICCDVHRLRRFPPL